MSRNQLSQQSRFSQLGAFSILAGVTLLTLLMFLVLVVDSGRLYMEQRTLQKVADIAALEAIARLPGNNCAAAPADALAFATQNAEQNRFAISPPVRRLGVACVEVTTENGLRHAQPSSTGAAVQVTANHQVPTSLLLQVVRIFNSEISQTTDLQAVAVAAQEAPSAAFSVGAQLLRLENNRLLGQLLTAVGLRPEELTVLDSDGLANAQITPAGLLAALGINVGIHELKALSPQGLVDLVETQADVLGLEKLIDLSLQAVSDSVVHAQLSALRAGILRNPLLRDLDLQLFGTGNTPALISLISGADGTVGSALDARINLDQLLSTGLMIGLHEEGRGLKLDELGLLGLATVKAGIVEPPSIGIGPVGTTAFNAQVRLLVDVDTSGGYVLGPLLDLLGTSIKLPVILDLVDATGTLEAINCTATPPEATIEVDSRVGSLCIGNMPESTLWSTRGSCTTSVEDENLIRLLGINILRGHVSLPVLSQLDELTLQEGETGSTQVNTLPIGTLVQQLIDELLRLLRTSSSVPESFSPGQAATLADRFLNLPELAPTRADGHYTGGDLDRLRDRLRSDGINWERPIFLFSGTMLNQWRNNTSNRCNAANILQTPRYDPDCVRSELISSLQTEARAGLLGELLGSLFGNVVQPLLATVLAPVAELLKPILDSVGGLLTTILADVLGLELGRTDVEVHAISCGAPALVL